MTVSDVSAVIVSYNQKQALLELLNLLLTEPAFHGLYIILIENASTDGSLKAVKELWKDEKRLQVIEQSINRGGAGGFRIGVNEAMKGNRPLFWLLDDDSLPDSDALSQLLKAAEELEKTGERESRWGALGSVITQKENPHLITESGGGISWVRAKLKAYNQGKSLNDLPETPSIVGHAAAASLLINRTVVKECGFFKDIFLHFDDVEWCYRIALRGYPVYNVPTSHVSHPFKKGQTAPWIRYYDARNILELYNSIHPELQFIAWLRFRLMALVFRFLGKKEACSMIKLGQRDFADAIIRLRTELP